MVSSPGGDADMTIQMACQRLGKSESTIRRWIQTGKLTATKVNGIWQVEDAAIDDLSNDYSSGGQAEARLQSENKYLRGRIEELEKARERQDTIMLELTRQLHDQQQLLEYHQEPFWRRWFRRNRPDE